MEGIIIDRKQIRTVPNPNTPGCVCVSMLWRQIVGIRSIHDIGYLPENVLDVIYLKRRQCRTDVNPTEWNFETLNSAFT